MCAGYLNGVLNGWLSGEAKGCPGVSLKGLISFHPRVHLSFSWNYVGVPQPKVEWFKDAVPLSKLANPRYKVATATGLTVRRVQPGDGGIFQCLAHNAAGEAQAYTQVFVSGEFDTHFFLFF